MVIINKNKEDKKLELTRFNEILKDYKSGKDVITGGEFILEEGLVLPPQTALVLELK
jgi:neopullulanase